MADTTLKQFMNHSRRWRENFYVYPVISRRSRGLSIGVNLNPDKACNFDCVYCQVDRSKAPPIREVDLDRLGEELGVMMELARSGELYEDEMFSDVPSELRRINDIAFSGDGEPTTCKWFFECVELVASAKRQAGLFQTKIILITDACYLTKPDVVKALAMMDQNVGEIWAKLDAGTEEYYQRVNRPNFPLAHVIENIKATARVRPVVIQSLFMKLAGAGPDESEVGAFCDRLNEIRNAGGKISYVQVYTIARPPAEDFVMPLSNHHVDRIVSLVEQRAKVRAIAFYGG